MSYVLSLENQPGVALVRFTSMGDATCPQCVTERLVLYAYVLWRMWEEKKPAKAVGSYYCGLPCYWDAQKSSIIRMSNHTCLVRFSQPFTGNVGYRCFRCKRQPRTLYNYTVWWHLRDPRPIASKNTWYCNTTCYDLDTV